MELKESIFIQPSYRNDVHGIHSMELKEMLEPGDSGSPVFLGIHSMELKDIRVDSEGYADTIVYESIQWN